MKEIDLAVIGGGPAGLAAAVSAHENGIRDILVLERDQVLGGILGQCIHNGFGLHKFKEELTGPEYAARYINKVRSLGIACLPGTTVLSVTPEREITAVNESDGVFTIRAKAVVLAMGCRERPLGALDISGNRPAGVYTAGTAQKLVNLMGYLPGREVVILGSGDIGLIMARRMTLEGAHVKAVCEIMPYSGGLRRNIVQCLDDFDIPLLLSHTVTQIYGKERVEGVTISQVDEALRPIPGMNYEIPCDTLLLSVGLIPENELSQAAGVRLDRATSGAFVDQDRQTSIRGIFACGNVLHVHDLVDYVSEEAELAGRAAAASIKDERRPSGDIPVSAGSGVKYVVPQHISRPCNLDLFFRVDKCFESGIINASDLNAPAGANLKKRLLHHNPPIDSSLEGYGIIAIRADDKTILRSRRQRAVPGEMQRISVPEAALRGAKHITVEVTDE